MLRLLTPTNQRLMNKNNFKTTAMKKVFNIFLPPSRKFKCLTIWPFVFVRLEHKYNYTKTDDNHENMHGIQQLEMMTVVAILLLFSATAFSFSFLWVLTSPLWYFAFYVLEYALRWLLCGFDSWSAYRNISFEQEAFLYQSDFNYLKTRKPFASFRYLFRQTYRKKA